MAELELGPLRFGVIGAGRLGTVLARALVAQGFTLVAVSSASEHGRAAATRALQVPAFADPAQVLTEVDAVLLCVPDDALAPTCELLAHTLHADLSNRATGTGAEHSALRIVHTSGAVGLAVLDPLHRAGCHVLGLHPLQTITAASSPGDLRGAAAAITAHDIAGATFGHALAHALGLHPFDLTDDQRGLYHAAAAIAANFTVTLQAAVQQLAAAAGLPRDVATHGYAALARAALDRAEREGPGAALTGPIVRGDTGTVAAHLRALDEHAPGVAALYRTLAAATVDVAVDAGRLDMGTAALFGDTLGGQPCA
jgi:predicted short-subunit dehydrogenase-like oxidoreductase (DUF2520 family)